LKIARKNTELIPVPYVDIASDTDDLLLTKNSFVSKCQNGFSLIEVMISAVVISTSLLGVLSMQMIGMKGTHHSYMKQQAMGVVQNAMERMAANRAAVLTGDYVVDSKTLNCATPPNCSTTSCSPADIALLDKITLVCGYQADSAPRTGGVKIENATDMSALLEGSLKIDCRNACALGDVTVSVGWTERAIGDEVVEKDFLKLNLRIGAP